MKQAIVESAREICGSLREETTRRVWGERLGKRMLRRRSRELELKVQNKDVWKLTKSKKESLKGVYIKYRMR